jgi:hypothetical protein
MKRTTFTMSLSREVFSRLTAMSRRMDISRAAVVRMALSDFFRRHDADPKDMLILNQTAAATEHSKLEGSVPLGFRLNKMKDSLKTEISVPEVGKEKRRRKNRLDLPSIPQEPSTPDKEPKS